jgi:hypothetical protein
MLDAHARRMQRQEALIAGDHLPGSIASPGPSSPLALRRVSPMFVANSYAAWQHLRKLFDMEGVVEAGGVFRVLLPRADVATTVFGTLVSPTFAFATDIVFLRLSNGLVLTKYTFALLGSEVGPVMAELASEDAGDQTSACAALHDHLMNVEPHVRHLHGSLRGDLMDISATLYRALKLTATPLGRQVPRESSPFSESERIEKVVGALGTLTDGVLTIPVPRSDTLYENDVVLPAAMQVASSLAFQSTGDGHVAARAEFVLRPEEVGRVAGALQSVGILVTALHHTEPNVRPRICHLHAWATGSPIELARGFRAALDLTSSSLEH